MTARLHILRTPLTAGPADAVARLGAADGTLWLTPTAEAAADLRAALGRAAAASFPFVFDLQSFADELVRTHDPLARPLPSHQRRLLLDAAAAEAADAGELPAGRVESRGFADAADGFVAECQRAGLDPKALPRGRRSGPDPLARLLAAFERKRAKLRRLTPEDRLARAAVLWAAGKREPLAGVRRVVAAGFAALAAVERRLLAVLLESVGELWLAVPDGGGGRDELFAGPRGMVGTWVRPGGDLFAAVDPPAIDVINERWGAITPPPAPPRGGEGGKSGSPSPPRGGGWGEGFPPRPSGLAHLAASLFAEPPVASPDAAGVHLIEAPGTVGEARLVARRIRTLLAAGAPPSSIVVTARHLDRSLDVLREVFDEYAIPHDGPRPDPLIRSPAVAFLLRAWRLPDDDFPFAAVAALLRSTYFRPPWEAVAADPDLPMRAEALLRQVGEPRGKEAYLAAVRAWAESPPLPLEDEQAEEPRRKRLGRLAVRCRGFLGQFFALWDRTPRTATPAEFAARLKRFAADIGLSSDRLGGADAAAVTRFWEELDRWARADGPAVLARKSLTKAAFARQCAVLAAACPQPGPPPADAVRLRPPDEACLLECDHLFVVGLGEGSFPDPSPPDSLLTDADRDRLRAAGADLPDPADRRAAEMLLFARLVSRPRESLALGYPAVDGKGQPLLPSSFLLAAKACFADGAVPVTRQRMLIEGYAREPLSAAELRVWAARKPTDSDPRALPPDLADNLRAARAAAAARFHDRQFGPFDGLLRHGPLVRELAERFGPQKVFSPTALEAYVACPFRFWLEHVLRLEPLEDPGEEVEHTRRGAAVHRALARFHRRLRDEAPHRLTSAELPEELGPELEADLLAAVQEYADRAPSAAGRVLWELEGRRLVRSLRRYRGHWDAFRTPWRKEGATPTPHALEADFGVIGEDGQDIPEPLVVRVGGVEVRVGGRIDRVDVAELADGVGFWVIDYKTGRGEHYTGKDIERFEKLQLPLYAVAVERVLLADRPARPLGLAYWLVTDAGPKPVLPGRKPLAWLADAAAWAKFRDQLEAWVAALASHVRAGDFPLAPRSETCTDTCPFGPVCRISQSRATGKVFPIGLPVVPANAPKEPGNRPAA